MHEELTVTQAAAKTGLTRAGIVHAIRNHHLAARWEEVPIRHYRIACDELERYLKNRPMRGPRPLKAAKD